MKRSIYFNPIFVLVVVLVAMWLPWLGETLFYSKGEPREAVVAMAMLQSSDWVLPVSCGDQIPYKPPFLAWLIAGFAWIFNGGVVNEFVSRLPSVIAAVALVIASYLWVRKARGEQFAMVMSLILATSFEYFRAATACRVDMVLTACMVGAMYMIFEIQSRKLRDNFWRYCAVILLLSCAVLTKGPIGALLPCFVMGVYNLLQGERFMGTLVKMLALSVAACVLPAIWYYAAWQRGGDGFLQLVWEENFMRLTGTMTYESHVKPFWYNFVTIIVGMLPWTIFALIALCGARRYEQRPLKPSGMLAVTAVAVIVLFYCIPASKRSVYLLPVYPFLAYGVASIAETLHETRINISFARIMAVVGIIVPVAVIVTIFYPIAGYSFTPVGWWAYLLLLLPLVISVLWLMQAHRNNAMVGVAFIFWALLTCYDGALMPWVLNPNSDKEVAEKLVDRAGVDMQIYAIASRTYALNYYLGDRMGFLESTEAVDTLPEGTILIFSNESDTVGLPAHYKLELLTERLSDTRRPAWLTVVSNRYAVDSLETSLSEPVRAAQISPE